MSSVNERVALNADIVGYSALVADDLASMTNTMATYHGLVDDQVASNGGTLGNFVGDSFLGHRVNLEAGAIIANCRNELDHPTISFVHQGETVDTGVEKFGALLGDRTKLGANAVIAPGAILAPDSIVKRLSLVDQRATMDVGQEPSR